MRLRSKGQLTVPPEVREYLGLHEGDEEAIARAADEGPLVINPIVYAEVSVDFRSIEELDEALDDADLRREPLPFDAGFLAGKAYLSSRRRGGTRRSPLADFYIGAHAAVSGHRLLTRDSARYSNYFPTVPLLTP